MLYYFNFPTYQVPWDADAEGGVDTRATLDQTNALKDKLASKMVSPGVYQDLTPDEIASAANMGLDPKMKQDGQYITAAVDSSGKVVAVPNEPSSDSWFDKLMSNTAGLIPKAVTGAGESVLEDVVRPVGENLDYYSPQIAQVLGTTAGAIVGGPVGAGLVSGTMAYGGGATPLEAVKQGLITGALVYAGGKLYDAVSGATVETPVGFDEFNMNPESTGFLADNVTPTGMEELPYSPDLPPVPTPGTEDTINVNNELPGEDVTYSESTAPETTPETTPVDTGIPEERGDFEVERYRDVAREIKIAVDNGLPPDPALWKTSEKLQAAALGLTALTTLAAIVDNGDKTVSGSVQTTGPGDSPFPTGNMPVGNTPVGNAPIGTAPTDTGVTPGVTPTPLPTMTNPDGTPKAVKDVTRDDFIETFYGLRGGGSTQEKMLADQATQTGLEKGFLDTKTGLTNTRLTDTAAAATPYQKLLSDSVLNAQNKTGNFKPINLSFGGNPITSFVPKQNIALDKYTNETGLQKFGVDTGLIDQTYNSKLGVAGDTLNFGVNNLPNKASLNYTDKLNELMKYFNPNGQTTTTTDTVPGVPWYTTALQGLKTGTDIYSQLAGQRQPTYTLEQLRALTGGG